MAGTARQQRTGISRPQPRSTTARIYAGMADAGARRYVRERDLVKLIALWPREIEDRSTKGALHILAKLRRALRAERTRGLAGHWSYDLNRHLGLLSAFKGELTSYRAMQLSCNESAGFRPQP
jgi:hypothetical protein